MRIGEHSVGPLQYLKIKALGVNLENVDPRNGVVPAVSINRHNGNGNLALHLAPPFRAERQERTHVRILIFAELQSAVLSADAAVVQDDIAIRETAVSNFANVEGLGSKAWIIALGNTPRIVKAVWPTLAPISNNTGTFSSFRKDVMSSHGSGNPRGE